MFGFGKKKEPPQRPERARRSAESKDRKSQNLAQLGFLTGADDGDIDNLMGGMEFGDDDLEEELAMLLEGNSPARRPKVSPTKNAAGSSAATKRSARNAANFDMDNPALDEDEGDDDIDDPELEAELGDILGVPTSSNVNRNLQMDDNDEEEDSSEGSAPAPPTMTSEQLIKLLQERLTLYEKAKSVADAANDSAKSRRFARGIKTLKEMLPKAKAGRVIDEADIPPAVSVGIKPSTSGNSQPSYPSPIMGPIESVSKPDRISSSSLSMQPAQQDSGSDNIQNQLPDPLVPTPTFVSHPVSADTSEKTLPPPDIRHDHPNATAAKTREMDPSVEGRLKDYKRAAVILKRQGDVQGAVKYLKLSKQLESRVKCGDVIDISEYPTVESEGTFPNEGSTQGATPITASAEPAPPSIPVNPEVTTSLSESGAAVPPPSEDIFGAPPPAKSIMEALEQRLMKYKSEVEKANAASNSSKARRMGRIVKQYEEAIVNHKKGKPVVYDELPTPPGFAPIPINSAAPQGGQSVPLQEPAVRQQQPPMVPPATSSATPEKQAKQDQPNIAFGSEKRPSPGTSGSMVSRSGKPGAKLTLQEKQLQIITLRQEQFKEAALNAKKRGDINEAREFLRTAKGFDKLIQVARAGLPVDMATLPSPPEAVARLETEDIDNFEVISASDCIMPTGSTAEVFAKLENDLKQQLKMCMRTRDHFKSIGDVASANRFESMALESKRDLDALRLAMKKNSDVLPKYHYENRIFSITECNTDVAEDEIEINIIQGINYKVSNPADVDTYVRLELAYPSAEEAQSNKTHVVKDTNNPAYNATYKMAINRTARNFQRFVHRHGFKCEVWSKGGFLRGSTMIGTASVKLLPLETKCTLHDAFDVLDGRKSVGKLEVKVRIREPVLAKQITQKKEKWLSIDRS